MRSISRMRQSFVQRVRGFVAISISAGMYLYPRAGGREQARENLHYRGANDTFREGRSLLKITHVSLFISGILCADIERYATQILVL